MVCGFGSIKPHDESPGMVLVSGKAGAAGVVKIGDDTPHPIEYIVDVPLSHTDQKGIMRNVLYVPTITKKLLLVGQIVNQGTQVQFTHPGCFIEEEGKIIVHGHQEGRMFILKTNDVGTTMIAKRKKVESDTDLWYKQFC